MVRSEREMVSQLQPDEATTPERSTSLQPTYEDSIPPRPEDDWDSDD